MNARWILVVLFGLAGHLTAENWPCFRGPTRQGESRETGLPLQWNATENVAWKTAIPGESWSSPIVWGEIAWQERVGGNFSGSPVSAEGRIWFVADDGETNFVAAGPEFKVLAKNPLGEKVQASPAIAQGRLFIRTERHLFCIGSK